MSLMDLLTQSPGAQNTFDPVLMVFCMFTEKRIEKLKIQKQEAFGGETIQLKQSYWIVHLEKRKQTNCSV